MIDCRFMAINLAEFAIISTRKTPSDPNNFRFALFALFIAKHLTASAFEATGTKDPSLWEDTWDRKLSAPS